MSAGVPGPKSATQQNKRKAYASLVGPIRKAAKGDIETLCSPAYCDLCAKTRLARKIIKLIDAGLTKLV